MKRKYLASILLVLCLLLGAGSAEAKSLYVIEDINAPTNIPIAAYDIQTSQIVKQTTHTIPDRNGGAVGITIDSDSGYLFVTFEFSGMLDVVDGTTMTTVGQVTAPAASNLAGIVVDQDQQRVYTVDRGTSKLYVYDWVAATQTLTLVSGAPFTLSGANAYGIALDEINDVLYVASGNNIIRYYDTATWTLQGTHAMSSNAIGVAVDAQRGFLYSGGWDDYVLVKYDLNTNTEATTTLGGKPIGLAVDLATGNLFVTTYIEDHLRMMDSDLNVLDETGDIGNPTGVCVPGKDISYNPLNLAKTDSVDPVSPGGTLTYTITYQNTNNFPVYNVVITDTLPSEVTFVSATGGGTESAGVVTWNIGTLAPSESGSVQVVVTVNLGTSGTIVNSALIDSDETPPTTQNENTVVRTDGVIPEFPTVAIPVAAILGLMFLIQRRKD